MTNHNPTPTSWDLVPGEADDVLAVRNGVRALLRLAGDDPDREGVLDTPDRFLKAYLELCGRPGNPAALLATTFDTGHDADSMIHIGGIPFTSVCEHHLLPFTGTAWVAYLPTHRVVGLSKIPRLVHHYALRPQLQERLTEQITTAIDQHLETRGSACVVKATHSCMSLRGVKAVGAHMVTSSLTGTFRTDPAARAEFMATID